jgi:single-stranded-DNA-specific exonuclease
VAAESPQFLFVMDLGSQPQEIVKDVPVCFIDHHRPGGALEKDTLISAYTWEPVSKYISDCLRLVF